MQRLGRMFLNAAVGLVLLLCSARADAFWVVNFGPAGTLPPGVVGFAAGLGGQLVFTGDPTQTNGFFTIPHAGVRVGRRTSGPGFQYGLMRATAF